MMTKVKMILKTGMKRLKNRNVKNKMKNIFNTDIKIMLHVRIKCKNMITPKIDEIIHVEKHEIYEIINPEKHVK